MVLFNFRSDRMVELSKAFEYRDPGKFTAFDRERVPDVKFVGMMQYDGDLKLPAHYLVPPPAIAKTSGEWLAHNGLRTFACSETQKFGHVTFFWNGNRSVRACCAARLEDNPCCRTLCHVCMLLMRALLLLRRRVTSMRSWRRARPTLSHVACIEPLHAC